VSQLRDYPLLFSIALMTACVTSVNERGEAYIPPAPAATEAPAAKPTNPGETGSTGAVAVTGPTGVSNLPPPPVQDGTWDHPFILSSFPTTRTGDTSVGGVSVEDVYTPCGGIISEKGPEFVYMLEAPDNGTLSVSVNDVPGDQVDLDVHLLDAKSASACIARSNVSFSNTIEGGKTYFIVVDTWWNGTHALVGSFELTVNFVASPVSGGSCPPDMRTVSAPSGTVCMDTFEAPNKVGELPFVMYSFDQSEAWCQARGKRLCFDDEWTYACAGPTNKTYSWGNDAKASNCNTKKTWLATNETLIGQWPNSANKATHESKADHFADAAMIKPASVDFVQSIYQAEAAGSFPECVGEGGVRDLLGSVEEWTRRRDGGVPNGRGNLKGRYWAELRTCGGGVIYKPQVPSGHADAFLFYEIGFRCCKTP
jgi:hypothetical protein